MLPPLLPFVPVGLRSVTTFETFLFRVHIGLFVFAMNRLLLLLRPRKGQLFSLFSHINPLNLGAGNLDHRTVIVVIVSFRRRPLVLIEISDKAPRRRKLLRNVRWNGCRTYARGVTVKISIFTDTGGNNIDYEKSCEETTVEIGREQLHRHFLLDSRHGIIRHSTQYFTSVLIHHSTRTFRQHQQQYV